MSDERMRNKSFKLAPPPSLSLSLPSIRQTDTQGPPPPPPPPRSRASLRTAEHYVCTLAEVFAFGKFAEAKLKLADRSRGIRSISFP